MQVELAEASAGSQRFVGIKSWVDNHNVWNPRAVKLVAACGFQRFWRFLCRFHDSGFFQSFEHKLLVYFLLANQLTTKQGNNWFTGGTNHIQIDWVDQITRNARGKCLLLFK